MKSRAEAARFIEKQMHYAWVCKFEKSAHHYGFCELRELMDFIFESEPLSEFDKIRNTNSSKDGGVDAELSRLLETKGTLR